MLLPLHLNTAQANLPGPPASVDTDLQVVSADTSTGNQTIALSNGFGTAAGVVIVLARTDVDVDDSGTPAVHGSMSYGVGTWKLGFPARQWAMAGAVENSVTDQYRWMVSDAIILLMDPTDGTVEAKASLVAMNSDEVIINWSTAPGNDYKMWVFAIGGDGISMDVGNSTTSATIGGVDTVTPGTAEIPTGFIMAAQGSVGLSQIDDAAALKGPCRMCVGFGSYDGQSIRQASAAVSWTINLGSGVSEAYIGFISEAGSELAEPQFELTGIAQNQFSVTTRTVAAAADYGWAAIYGADCHVDLQEAAASGSLEFDYPVGVTPFAPVGGLFIGTLMNTTDVESEITNARAGGWGAGAVDSGGSEASAAMSYKRNASSPNEVAQVIFDDVYWHNPVHGGGTGGQEIEWTSWDSDGFTSNVLVQLSTTRVAPMLLMGNVVPATAPATTSSPQAWATQSGAEVASAAQSGPVEAQGVQSGSVVSMASQSGAVAAQAVQSGAVASQGVQDA